MSSLLNSTCKRSRQGCNSHEAEIQTESSKFKIQVQYLIIWILQYYILLKA